MADNYDLSEKFYQLQQSTTLISDADGLEIHLINVLKSMISCNSILIFHNNKDRQLLAARNPFNLSQNESQSLTIHYDDPVGVDILVLRKSISRINPQSPVLPSMHAELFAPLNSPDIVLGCIYVSRLSPKGFTADDMKVVEHAAGLLARALERQEWEKRLRSLQNGSLAWQEKYIGLLHTLPFPAMIVDKKSQIVEEANEAADQLFGPNQGSAVDASLSHILETQSEPESSRTERRIKIKGAFYQVRRRDIVEFGAEKNLFLFMAETPEADKDEDMRQFHAALQSLPDKSSNMSDFILQAALLVQQVVAFDYFSITLIDEYSGEVQPFVLCVPALKNQLPAGSSWQPIEKTNLGWATMAAAQKAAAKSGAGGSGALPHSLPVHISFLLMHGEAYLGNLALARQQQTQFDDGQRTRLRTMSKYISKLLVSKKEAVRLQAIEKLAKSCLEISSALEDAGNDETEVIERMTQLASVHLQTKDFYLFKINEHESDARLDFLPARLERIVMKDKLKTFFDMLHATQRPVCVHNQAAFSEYFCAEGHDKALQEFAPFVITPVADARRLYACFVFPWENDLPFHDMSRHLLKPLAGLLRDRLLSARLNRRLTARARESCRLMDIVTRDLSAPLSEMKGVATLLTQRYAKDLSGGAQDYLQNIAAGLKSFEKLIAGLAEFQKIDQLKQVSDVDCNAIIQTALARVKPLMPTVHIKTPTSYPAVRGNEEALLLIFINLLANAARAVEKVRSPVIEIGVGEKEKFIEFFVHDNGSGVDPSLQDKIFELFYKQENNSNDAAGLGLAIVRKAVHAHGGRVWLAVKKSGAEFRFTIPKGLVVMTDMAPYSG